jgi:hypothetical protein
VMRKDEVDPAAVDVDGRLAQQSQRHGRALEVPSGAAAAETEVPARLADVSLAVPGRPGRLPQHEVARVGFVVVVRIDTGAGFQPVMIEGLPLRSRQRRNLEVTERRCACVALGPERWRSRHAGGWPRGRAGHLCWPRGRARPRNAAIHWSVYSGALPAFWIRIVRSSTSVKFMTCRIS